MAMMFRFVLILLLVLSCHSMAADAETSAQITRVMAILKANCIDCHNQKKAKAELRMHTREALLKGSENGPVVVAGKPAKSRLIDVLDADADEHMPPKGQLKDEEIALLANWVREGLPWDGEAMREASPGRVEPRELPAFYQPGFAIASDTNNLAWSSGAELLVRNAKGSVTTNSVHRDAVRAIALSKDGKLASASQGLILIDERTFETDGLVTALAWEGSILVAAVGDPGGPSSLWRWDAKKKDAKPTLTPGHPDSITELLPLSDGHFASASVDGTVKIWSNDFATVVRTLEGHTSYVTALALDPEDKLLASGGSDQRIQVWDWRIGFIERTLSGHDTDISGLQWTKAGLFATGLDGRLRRYKDKSTKADRSSDPGPPLHDLAPNGDGWFAVDAAGRLLEHDKHLKRKTPAAIPERKPTPKLSFLHDILPVLNRAGCNAGECHARQGGQAGFQLTVFSFDPQADYRAVVHAAGGRRIFPAAPEHSLLLRKPSRLLPHEGGQRFKPGSEAWNTLVAWIEDGMAYDRDGPELVRISVTPAAKTVDPGGAFDLAVTAHFDDKSSRDVTGLALFDATDPVAAEVDASGRVRAVLQPGEAAVLARYMGQVAVCAVTVPPTNEIPASAFKKLPVANLIDTQAWPRLRALGFEPSTRCDDATFLRRAALDIAGRAPTVDEARAFLADISKDKRAAWVKVLLRDPNTPEYWAGKWADLLRPNPDRAGIKSVYVIDQWLRASFRANQPMDEFARAILTAEGNTHRHGPTVVYRDKREATDLANVFTRLFLGVRLDCARCHHHPNERWSQTDFYQTAAFFKDLKRKGKGVSPPISGDHETFWHAPGRDLLHPVTKAVMKPVPPGADPIEIAEGQDPREVFADWALGTDFFAKAMVNRVWAAFFGRGFVEPVDDFRASNPAVHPELLDALAADFAKHDFDLHHLIRTITASELYQRSDAPTASNAGDQRNFSRSLRRRLPAEVLADLVADATGVPHKFEGMAPGSRAVHTWNVKIASDFLDAFGRPDAAEDPPCERNQETSLVQTLHLMHAEDIQRRLADENGRVATLAKSELEPEAAIEELYLAALSRPPTAEETNVARKAFDAKDASRQTALEDILWSLFNSAEFVFNH